MCIFNDFLDFLALSLVLVNDDLGWIYIFYDFYFDNRFFLIIFHWRTIISIDIGGLFDPIVCIDFQLLFLQLDVDVFQIFVKLFLGFLRTGGSWVNAGYHEWLLVIFGVLSVVLNHLRINVFLNYLGRQNWFNSCSDLQEITTWVWF